MSKIKRNAPCPCGSGKKYKKCCLQKDEAQFIADRAKQVNENQLTELEEGDIFEEFYHEAEELGRKSNSVIDLIKAKDFKQAERICNELLDQYPDQIDGLERFAMLYEAIGNNEKAIEYYKKTAAFAQTHKGFDSDIVDWALNKAKGLQV